MSVGDGAFDRPLGDGNIAAFDEQKQLLAVLRRDKGSYKYIKVFSRGA